MYVHLNAEYVYAETRGVVICRRVGADFLNRRFDFSFFCNGSQLISYMWIEAL